MKNLNPEDFKTELSQAELVRSSLKKITHPFKDFLAVPLEIKTKDNEKVLIDRLYNLGDVRNLLDPNKFILPETLEKYPDITGIARLTTEECHDAAIQAAQGLSALHKAGLVHGDFAARNLLARHKLDKNGNYKLEFAVSDWGSTLKDGQQPSRLSAIKWSSPEQLLKKQMTSKSDAWNFGVFLLELMVPEGDIHRIFTDRAIDHGMRLTTSDLSEPNENLYMKNLLEKYLEDKKLQLDPEIKLLILNCFYNDPESRPSMNIILNQLERWKSQGKFIGFQ